MRGLRKVCALRLSHCVLFISGLSGHPNLQAGGDYMSENLVCLTGALRPVMTRGMQKKILLHEVVLFG